MSDASNIVSLHPCKSLYIFSSKPKARRCLQHNERLECKGHSKNAVSLNSLNICRQNITAQRSQSDELANSFEIYCINYPILCLSEHLIKEQDLLILTLSSYTLGSCFCLRNAIGMWVFLFGKSMYATNKMVFGITEEKMAWKSVEFTFRVKTLTS